MQDHYYPEEELVALYEGHDPNGDGPVAEPIAEEEIVEEETPAA